MRSKKKLPSAMRNSLENTPWYMFLVRRIVVTSVVVFVLYTMLCFVLDVQHKHAVYTEERRHAMIESNKAECTELVLRNAGWHYSCNEFERKRDQTPLARAARDAADIRIRAILNIPSEMCPVDSQCRTAVLYGLLRVVDYWWVPMALVALCVLKSYFSADKGRLPMERTPSEEAAWDSSWWTTPRSQELSTIHSRTAVHPTYGMSRPSSPTNSDRESEHGFLAYPCEMDPVLEVGDRKKFE